MKHNLLSCPVWMGLAVFTFLSGSQALAGGLYLSEIASPASVGTAGVANVVNRFGPDSAFTNPAGMTGLDTDAAVGGIQVLVPNATFDSSIAEAGGNDGGNAANIALIPGFAMVKVLDEDTRFGLSVVGTHGGGVDYRNDFVGRYQANKSILSGLGVSPSLAYRLGDRVSLGLGVTFLYTTFDLDISLNQAAVNPALSDGEVRFEGMDDWSYQGFVGLTLDLTNHLMLGVTYRSKSEITLEGDVDFKNVQIPILEGLTRNVNQAELEFDLPQVVKVGLLYEPTDELRFVIDADWEQWSEFSSNAIELNTGPAGGTIGASIDRNWKDTYHVGAAVAYLPGKYAYTMGVGYDTSPVDDEDRTADIPVDRQLKVGAAIGRIDEKIGSWSWSVGGTYIDLGKAKMDQTAQGVRFKGEFDTNYVVFVAGSAVYRF